MEVFRRVEVRKGLLRRDTEVVMKPVRANRLPQPGRGGQQKDNEATSGCRCDRRLRQQVCAGFVRKTACLRLRSSHVSAARTARGTMESRKETEPRLKLLFVVAHKIRGRRAGCCRPSASWPAQPPGCRSRALPVLDDHRGVSDRSTRDGADLWSRQGRSAGSGG